MTSSVLLLAPPLDWRDDLGSERVSSLKEAQKVLETSRFDCLVIFVSEIKGKGLASWVQLIHEAKFDHKIILVYRENWQEVVPWLNGRAPESICAESEHNQITATIRQVLESEQLKEQERVRLEMVQEQTHQMQEVGQKLSERIERRQKSLAKQRQRLLYTNHQIEALHAALTAIHKARSSFELEKLLKEALEFHLQLSQTRVRFSAQSSNLNRDELRAKGAFLHEEPLVLNEREIGQIQFLREKFDFQDQELDLLKQIAENVALGLDRLAKLEQADVLKQQWQATFDAFTEALCLTDSQFRILRTNQKYSQIIGQSTRQVVGRNCFELFFDPSQVPEFFTLGPAFRIRRNRFDGRQTQTFEVSSQPLHFSTFEGEVLLVLFRDISSRLQMERQLVETSKMAELGLIGSSIAHELNNPLGGMLSFIQLIRMDLKGHEPYADDVKQMEEAAKKCRDIVINLLGFARRSDANDRRPMDVREALSQALKISDLLTRSQGISVQVQLPNEPVMINGQQNQFTQALCNLLQNAGEAILEKRKSDFKAKAEMLVTLKRKQNHFELEIQDSGVGIEPEILRKVFNPLFTTKTSKVNSGLGLTMSFKILSEHFAKLEIFSQPGVGTTAKITLPEQDLATGSQVFDAENLTVPKPLP